MTSPSVSPIVITIVRKSDGRIAPQEDSATTGIRTTVPSGAAIEFRPGGGATSVAVHFDNESPFGDRPEDKKNVRKGVIKKSFNTVNAKKNTYAYRCELEIDGERVQWPAKGAKGKGDQGGEIEIVS